MHKDKVRVQTQININLNRESWVPLSFNFFTALALNLYNPCSDMSSGKYHIETFTRLHLKDSQLRNVS